MSGPNSFIRGTRDKWGQLFGVALTREERSVYRAMAGSPVSDRARWNNSAKHRAKKHPPTKIKLKWLEDN